MKNWKRLAIVCDTKLQILNSINLFYHLYNDILCDIYLSDNIDQIDDIIERLCNENLFTSVNKYKYIPYTESNIKKIAETIFPNKHLHYALYDKKSVETDKYDLVFIAVPTVFSTILMMTCPCAKLIYYEDGMGNYNGAVRIHEHSIRKKITNCLKRKYPNFIPIEMYVYNVDICEKNGIERTEQMPRPSGWNDDFINLIRRVFSYSLTDTYKSNLFIYLTQPNDDNSNKIKSIDKRVIASLKSKRQDCIIRRHPRDNEEYEKSLNVDNGNNMWELICLDAITSDHVLIGQYSTAQIVPKLMFEKEPHLIFTYALYSGARSEEKIKEISKAIENIKNMYDDTSKVHIVQDFEDLSEVISRI